jgi:arginase
MKCINPIYVPYDSGHKNVRMGCGPLHLQAHGAAARLRAAGLQVTEKVIDVTAAFPTEVRAAFDLHRLVGDAVSAALASGAFPVVVAGNCNTAAIGTIAGVGTSDTGILWLDAHDDCETPDTTTSGFLDGMALAMLTGQCWPQLLRKISGMEPLPGGHAVLIGARDVSAAAAHNLASAGIERIDVEDIQRHGASVAIIPAIQRLKSRGVRRLVIHVDLDVHDPVSVAPANCFAVPGGLHAADVIDLIQGSREQIEITAICLGSYDPGFDVHDRMLTTALTLMESAARAA